MLVGSTRSQTKKKSFQFVLLLLMLLRLFAIASIHIKWSEDGWVQSNDKNENI